MIFLREFAIERSALKAKLMFSFESIFPHLLLVYYYPTAEEVNHWEKEVYNFLNDVPVLKSTKRLPPEKLIKEGLWDSVKEIIPRRHGNFVKDVNLGEYGANLGQVKFDRRAEDFCREYCDWLAMRLSKDGSVSRFEVKTQIEKLLKDIRK